jgi:CarD family transcriptional regulator
MSLKELPIDISTGEHVHHPQHGIGKIQSVRKRSFYGLDEATYAQLYFKRDDLTFMLLKEDLSKTVRSLISASEARKVLQQIKQWDGEPKSQWKARADAHEAIITGGNPFEYAKVVKELNRMESADELRPRDRRNLYDTLDLLEQELTESLNKTPVQVRKLLEEALTE